MRDNIHLAQQFVTALTFDVFLGSKLHFYAVTRAVEIISEASRRLPDDLRDRYPQLPWRAIRDSGNFYRHQYEIVAETQIWALVHERLPELCEAVKREIANLEDSDLTP